MTRSKTQRPGRTRSNASFRQRVASIVLEVTDDKSLAKVERKKKQIEHAQDLSVGACLVKMADKLDNLTDLQRAAPESWSVARIRGYFVWAYHVIEAVRSPHPKLREALDAVFTTVGEDGEPYVPPLPEDRTAMLEAYYADLAS